MIASSVFRIASCVLLAFSLSSCVAYVPVGRPHPAYGYYLPPGPPPRPVYYGRPYYAPPVVVRPYGYRYY